VVLLGDRGRIDERAGDFVLSPARRELPPAGRMGVRFGSAGEAVVDRVTPGGAAGDAGLLPGDRVVAVDGAQVATVADARAVLWDKRPGDRIVVEVRRSLWLLGEVRLSRRVVLRPE
jgi:S1-C subfamily serine protease